MDRFVATKLAIYQCVQIPVALSLFSLVLFLGSCLVDS